MIFGKTFWYTISLMVRHMVYLFRFYPVTNCYTHLSSKHGKTYKQYIQEHKNGYYFKLLLLTSATTLGAGGVARVFAQAIHDLLGRRVHLRNNVVPSPGLQALHNTLL